MRLNTGDNGQQCSRNTRIDGGPGSGAAVTITTLGVPLVPRGPEGSAPSAGPLIDSYGRSATDLRVSLTDRCNLRCTYCMPADGLPWLGAEQLLAPDEIARLVRIAVTRLGVTKVRFTGGEPLLAKHLEYVVAEAAALQPRPELALTTNGVLLARHAEALARAGLDRVNVSLDSVDSAHFSAITRRNRLTEVLAGLAAAPAFLFPGVSGHCHNRWALVFSPMCIALYRVAIGPKSPRSVRVSLISAWAKIGSSRR